MRLQTEDPNNLDRVPEHDKNMGFETAKVCGIIHFLFYFSFLLLVLGNTVRKVIFSIVTVTLG